MVSPINGELSGDPAAQETVEPSVHLGRVMEVAFDVLVARACALHAKAHGIVDVPAVELGVGNLGMELYGDERAVPEGLVGVSTGGRGKKLRAAREPEPLPMPLIDVLWEGSEL